MNPLTSHADRDAWRARAPLGLRPGDELSGRFEIEKLTAAGGTGAIYRALDRQTGAPVAVKVLRHATRENVDLVVRDLGPLVDLAHPAIARTLGYGTTASGQVFVALEWLDGEPLARRLSREELSVLATLALGRRVATGLAFAHARGLSHGDISPASLLVPPGGVSETKILGFGLARAGEPIATPRGVVVGTLGYLAPEQAAGAAADPRADVFALGSVLYRALAGCSPFDADDAKAAIARVLFEDVPRVRKARPDVPAAVCDLLYRMTARDPADRPEDADAVLRELVPIHDAVARSAACEGGLSADEQRLVSVVVVAGRVERSALDRARAAAAPFGAKVEATPEGSVVAAIFGKGSARDQATHAARCGLALADVLDGSPIALATGCGGAGPKGVTGEVVERAVRLLRVAPASGRRFRGVAVDSVTASLLEPHFEVAQEGGATAVRRERALGRLDTTRSFEGRSMPFVGRQAEVEAIAAAHAAAVKGDGARAVLVSGPSGIGKSRLRAEVVDALRAKDEGAPVWVARADPADAATPFGMLAQFVRAIAGVGPGETLRARQAKLSTRVGRHVAPEEAQRVTEFFGELGDIRFPEAKSPPLQAARRNVALMTDQLRRAWEDFLDAETAAHPVFLVLEDVHWADLQTITLIGHALERFASRPLFVLATARPVVHALFPSMWAGPALTELRLSGLDAQAVEEAVRAMSPAAGDAVGQVVRGAGGNPFFAEEWIRAASAGRAGEVPEAVLAMIQGHLETLSPEARRVLRAASLLGMGFGRDALSRLTGPGERGGERLDASLAELVDRGVLAAENDAKRYVFHHAAFQRAALATLTDEDRVVGQKLAAGIGRARGGLAS